VLDVAARHILERHADELPDLSRTILLLPSLHAAAPFARALARAAGHPALLLPSLTTLPQLAKTVALPQPLVPDSARQSLIYSALRERAWFDEADLWPLAAELRGLFDQLTLHRVRLPRSLDDFTAQIAAAYHARAGSALQFEARLVHELWHAMHATLPEQVDHASAYQLRLAHLAAHADRPLYGLGLSGLTPAESEFLARYAQRQPVHLFEPDALIAEGGDVSRLLAAAWRGGDQELRPRAEQLRLELPDSPLAPRLRLFPAHSLEQEARAAETQIRLWLAEGKRSIAVVAQDRLAARRVRALLERADVLVEDETGWTLSTASASSVIMRWLDLLSSDFYHQDLLDFLKSPLVFADWPQAQRKEAVYALEQIIRRQNLVARLIHYRAAAHEADADCRELLERLYAAQKLWPKRTQPLAAWLDTLRQTLDLLGITAALQADLAGEQLLATLGLLQEELQKDRAKYALKEWRRWLDRQLETATFRDTEISSPVIFTHLPATRLRPFDAVVLLGCDAGKLPARSADGLLFNQAVRAQLGLPTREQDTQIELSDVAALLATAEATLVTWQQMINGEEHLVSPWFDLLQTLHRLAYEDELLDSRLAGLLATSGIAPPEAAPAAPTREPAPMLPTERVPEKISASGYNSLMACPYQYYARHGLKLYDVDEVQLEMEKRDFGDLVHRILLRFHRAHPTLRGKDTQALEQDLRLASETEFHPMLKLNYLSHAWQLRWESLIPSYIAWQLEREQNGWRWHGGETEKHRSFPLPDGKHITLRGTLDRVDQSPGGVAVIDYKTRSVDALRKQLKTEGEDVQLPVYALLAEGDVVEAGYLSLDKEVKAVPLPGNLAELSAAVAARLADMFAALHAGSPLPARGTDEACGRCEMQGLCRRDYFSKRSANG
jgi:ATP-dependent helicase/nuclease subunit B